MVKKCSACSKLIIERSVLIYNTIYSTLWTDGKTDIPMMSPMSRMDSLVKCPHCNSAVWIEDMETLGYLRRPRIWRDRAFKYAEAHSALNVAEYYSALGKDNQSAKQERYIRTRAWWLENDDSRKSGEARPLSSHEAENIMQLATLMDVSTANDLVLKIEILRELGHFDEAMNLANQSSDESVAKVVAIQKELIQKGDRCVRKVYST